MNYFSFRANVYPCPENPHERRELAMGVMTRLEDLTVVLSQTQDHRSRVLAATSRNLRTWQIKVKKIKAIYHTMNMFNNDVARKCLIAECWAPVSELDRIQLALRKGSVSILPEPELGKYRLSRLRVQRKSYSKTKILNIMTLKYVFNAIVV